MGSKILNCMGCIYIATTSLYRTYWEKKALKNDDQVGGYLFFSILKSCTESEENAVLH